MTTSFSLTHSAFSAARIYIARRDRKEHPDGRFDKGGRWYADDAETCACCASIREPSRSYPYSWLVHCRSAEHVAHKYECEVSTVKRAAKIVDFIDDIIYAASAADPRQTLKDLRLGMLTIADFADIAAEGLLTIEQATTLIAAMPTPRGKKAAAFVTDELPLAA